MAKVLAMGIAPSKFKVADSLHTTDFFGDQSATV
jgi:hypothetical protein